MEGATPVAPAAPAPSAPPGHTNGATGLAKPAPKPAKPAALATPGAAQAKPEDVFDEDKQAKAADAAKAAPPKQDSAEDYFEVQVGKEKRRLTRDEALRRLQKDVAVETRLRQAAEKEKALEERMARLRDAPESVLQELGLDVEKLAETRLAEKARAGLMTPEERAMAAKDAELADAQRQLKAIHDERKAQAKAQRNERLFQGFERAILEAAKASGLTPDDNAYVDFCQAGLEMLELDMELNPAHLAAEVKERRETAMHGLEQRVLKGLTGEPLLERLGPSVVNEVLKAAMQKIQTKNPYAPPENSAPPAENSRPPAKKKHISMDEFRRRHGL